MSRRTSLALSRLRYWLHPLQAPTYGTGIVASESLRVIDVRPTAPPHDPTYAEEPRSSASSHRLGGRDRTQQTPSLSRLRYWLHSFQAPRYGTSFVASEGRCGLQ